MSTAEDVDSQKLSEERKNYYDKWDKFTKEEVEKTEEQELEEKKKADEELGLADAIHSKAQKEDVDKRAALKEAKKAWEKKELDDSAKKFAVEDLEGVEKVLDSVKLHWKPVVLFKNIKNSKLKIPHDLKHKLIKVFVENCENCEIDFEVSSVTQHVEITRSTKCTFRVKCEISTMQLDICEDVKVQYGPGLFDGKDVRIFHAGVKNFEVETHEKGIHKHCFENDTTEEDTLKTEVQFVTFKKAGKVTTERVVRDRGNLPATADEIEEKELSAKTLIRDAELKKIGGNEAFAEKHYAQAAVFYTESLDILGTAKLKEDIAEEKDFTHILYANRAFCWQKLGHHEKAEEDARQCIKLKPDYCKGFFRLGLALHAQKKYFEAVPILGKASELEPKNEQIKQALGFAEIQMRKMMQGR